MNLPLFCSSIRHWFSAQDNFDKSEIQPLRAPLATLLDVDHLTAWASASDATVHRVRKLLFVRLTCARRHVCKPGSRAFYRRSMPMGSSSQQQQQQHCSEEGGALWC